MQAKLSRLENTEICKFILQQKQSDESNNNHQYSYQ